MKMTEKKNVDGGNKKVVLAYSGGLDTSVAIKWIKENYGADVITFTVELGQDAGDLKKFEEKAKTIGAIKTYSSDAREEFVRGYIIPAIKANALYQGIYPIGTSLARPLIAKMLVEIAEKEGAYAIAHGCTGKGNDQVRFDVTSMALKPGIQIIAPAREWDMGRDEEIDYAQKHGIPVSVTKKKPYSVDENLWCRSIEAGVMEFPDVEPPEDAFEWTASVDKAPNVAEYVEIEFEAGVPVALNGKKMGAVELIEKLNKIAGTHGVGRLDHMEDRIVGLKSREVYECPAAVVLIAAHKDLEKFVCTRHENNFKEALDSKWTQLVYEGLWVEPLREDIEAFINKVNEKVTGSVRVKLYKGSAIIVGRKSDYALYSLSLASYDKKKDLFNHKSAVGFIELFGLQSILANKIRMDMDLKRGKGKK